MDHELVDAATRRLRSADPDDFATLRDELAAAAKAADEADAAKAIGRIRKPTNPARIVNALVARDDGLVDRLTELGARMRAAQDDLDAARLRELTDERRALVADCTKRALASAGAGSPSAALRDDVLGTFDAAVADPDIAARLGALQRPERFSGFGFAADATPRLTLVQGGGAKPPKAGSRTKAAPRISAAERRRLRRALDEAQQTFDDADAALTTATTAERDATRNVARRERELRKAKETLDAAQEALGEARDEVKAVTRNRREARSALDRARRNAPEE